MIAKPKQKKCKAPGCVNTFEAFDSMKKWCSIDCAAAIGFQLLLKRDRVKKVEEKRIDRKERERQKTIPQLTKEAQTAFNAFIRARDKAAGHTCISSGKVLDWSGNATDCGHYRSTGAAKHLRFNENNAHAQSKHDNQYKAGNVVEYRIRLIQRIGLEAVEALEADNTVRKWTRDELREIRDSYRAKARQMEKEQ